MTMTKTTTGTEGWAMLAELAAELSRADGDGHRWDEDDARRWLLRTGSAGSIGSTGQVADDPCPPGRLQRAG